MNLGFIFGTTVQLLLAKIFFLVVVFLFTLFLVVVYKQTLSMEKLIKDKSDDRILNFSAGALLIISISLFLTALVIL